MIALLLFAAAATPAEPAKTYGPVEKQHRKVVEWVRGCPEAQEEDEIVVCSNDRGIAEGFRLPRLDQRFAGPLNKNGRTPSTDPALGAVGVGSCSATGAGGATGCSVRDYRAWGQWKAEQKQQAHAYEDPR